MRKKEHGESPDGYIVSLVIQVSAVSCFFYGFSSRLLCTLALLNADFPGAAFSSDGEQHLFFSPSISLTHTHIWMHAPFSLTEKQQCVFACVCLLSSWKTSHPSDFPKGFLCTSGCKQRYSCPIVASNPLHPKEDNNLFFFLFSFLLSSKLIPMNLHFLCTSYVSCIHCKNNYFYTFCSYLLCNSVCIQVV